MSPAATPEICERRVHALAQNIPLCEPTSYNRCHEKSEAQGSSMNTPGNVVIGDVYHVWIIQQNYARWRIKTPANVCFYVQSSAFETKDRLVPVT